MEWQDINNFAHFAMFNKRNKFDLDVFITLVHNGSERKVKGEVLHSNWFYVQFKKLEYKEDLPAMIKVFEYSEWRIAEVIACLDMETISWDVCVNIPSKDIYKQFILRNILAYLYNSDTHTEVLHSNRLTALAKLNLERTAMNMGCKIDLKSLILPIWPKFDGSDYIKSNPVTKPITPKPKVYFFAKGETA